MLKIMTYAIVGLSFFAFIFGLYSSKIVVTEMMGVLQLSYLGLFILNYSDPLVSPLYFFKYTNGYNYIFGREQGNVPYRVY